MASLPRRRSQGDNVLQKEDRRGKFPQRGWKKSTTATWRKNNFFFGMDRRKQKEGGGGEECLSVTFRQWGSHMSLPFGVEEGGTIVLVLGMRPPHTHQDSPLDLGYGLELTGCKKRGWFARKRGKEREKYPSFPLLWDLHSLEEKSCPVFSLLKEKLPTPVTRKLIKQREFVYLRIDTFTNFPSPIILCLDFVSLRDTLNRPHSVTSPHLDQPPPLPLTDCRKRWPPTVLADIGHSFGFVCVGKKNHSLKVKSSPTSISKSPPQSPLYTTLRGNSVPSQFPQECCLAGTLVLPWEYFSRSILLWLVISNLPSVLSAIFFTKPKKNLLHPLPGNWFLKP